MFRDQAGKTPDSISLACDREGNREIVTLTYRELNGSADRLAHLLIEKGVKENHLVGLLADRSVEMITGMLGILKAGGAYIPLNPKAPASRNKYILEECGTGILVSGGRGAAPISGLNKDIEVIDLNETLFTHPTYPTHPTHPTHLCYVIFTSGSTGNPKGVPITHANLSPLLHWGYRQLGLGPPDRVIQNLSYYFDWSVWEIFITITTGAGLIITSEEVLLNPQLCAAFIDKQNITALHITPSQYQYLAQTGRSLETLRYLFIGAEKLTLDLARRSFQLVKEGCRVFNMYGPTECTIITSVLELDVDTLDDYRHLTSVPIGPPAANVDYLVLDKYLKPCPTKINGELYIAGDGLAAGYISDPEKTCSAFVPNIYEGEGITGSRLYKTGDIARWLPDGTVEYLGRIDHQVKIRGYRIELGEIESRLLKHQNVRDTVVLVNEDASHDKYICAYLVPGPALSTMELKQYLAQQLPDYMVPSYFVQIEKIPLNPNGKLDRKALPLPGPKAEGEYKAPRDDVETKLVEIWAGVLGIEKDIIGIDTNFFQLGGHSLKATAVLSKIHKELEVKIPLVEIFTNPTVQELAECINGLTEEQYKTIEPVEKKDYYAVSSGQRRLYVLQQMEPESTVYNMPMVIPLGEEADTAKLETTFIRLIERHESFRTSFLPVNEEPVQRIHDHAALKIEIPTNINNFVRSFDLSAAPLLRVGLLLPGGGNPLLMVDMHHIVSDGVSFDILVQEFTHLYQGGDLPPLRIQYKDFAEWQTHQSQREAVKQQESFWLKTFEGEIPLLNLPTDYPRPAIQSFAGDTADFELSTDETAALKAFALESDVTLYMVLSAIFYILLSKLTGQEDIIIGSTVAGRRHADLEKIIGMFVNTLALRNSPNAEKSIKEFLREVKDNTLETFENQEYPFEELVEKVDIERNTGRNPLFDVMFTLQNIFEEEDSSTTMQDQYQYEDRTAKFDLTFAVGESGGRLLLGFQYCTSLFKRETIERFYSYFKKILLLFPGDPAVKLGQIEIVSEAEKRKILHDFNDTDKQYPLHRTVYQLFEEQVERTPDGIAVIGSGHRAGGTGASAAPGPLPCALTYGKLNEKADQLAHYLCRQPVEGNEPVAIITNKSPELIIGILAILKAACVYVPINSKLPPARVKYILDECHAGILLTTRDLYEEGRTVGRWEGEVIFLEERINVESFHAPCSMRHARPEDLAYVIFTSGSTGNPKGVPISHFNLSSLLHWEYRFMGLSPGDRVIQNLSYYFDWSVSEIFITLTSGASLSIVPDDVLLNPESCVASIDKYGVTALHVTPAQYKYLAQTGHRLETLKYLFIGAETLTFDLVRQSFQLVGGECRVFNMYGPTECTITATILELNPSHLEKFENLSSVPIGQPIANVKLLVLDRCLKLCPLMVTGELYIGGDLLAPGYLNDPEKSFNAFIRNPYEGEGIRGSRLYKTGDLSRRLPDGNIEFLGRIDHQVKIRGFRIELGEIESQLLKHENVRETVVLVKEDDTGDKYICAYVAARSREQGPGSEELRMFLSRKLVDYMIPSYFIQIEEIPLNPNGKVDRKALPEPGTVIERERKAPRDEVEAQLVDIWSDVLGTEKEMISIDADFFQVGGHSLKAAAMVSKMQKVFNAAVPLIEVFTKPSIEALAEYIRRKETAVEIPRAVNDDNLVLLKPHHSDNHLFLIHDGSGETEGYMEFCERLTRPFNCWGLRADRLENMAPRNCAIEEMAQRYIEKIRDIQPHGPYWIVGWSLGGTIAFEMAVQLEEMGVETGFLGLIDSPGPRVVSGEGTGEFTLESESDWFWEYLPGNEIKEKVKKAADINEIWPIIVTHLEENNFSVELVKQLIPDDLTRIIPHYDQSGIRELIYYLNIGRTLTNARALYIPAKKIHTTLHYFKASESPVIFQDSWNDYCLKPIKPYEIPGDHFSLLKKNGVEKTVKIFEFIVQDML